MVNAARWSFGEKVLVRGLRFKGDVSPDADSTEYLPHHGSVKHFASVCLEPRDGRIQLTFRISSSSPRQQGTQSYGNGHHSDTYTNEH